MPDQYAGKRCAPASPLVTSQASGWSGSWTQPTAPVEDVDQTLLWLLRRMMDEWGPAGVKAAVDRIVAVEMSPTHACPRGSDRLTPCCGRSPFDLPSTDRITLEPANVTCAGARPQESDR